MQNENKNEISNMVSRMLSGLVFCAVGVMTSGNLMGQAALDMPCQNTVFYGNAGSAIHRLQFNGTSVTDLGVLTTPSQNMFGLAYGMDITQGSTSRTLYGSAVNAGFNQSDILRYDGTAWTSVVTDSIIYHNAGAYGSYIYFMHSATSGQPNNQCISRLNANGTLTKIFTDTSLVFSVADLAVDSAGNVYCFRGTSIGATTQLIVLSPAGAILQTYSTNLNNLNTFYSSMFLNGTLYLGWNTVNGQLFPVNLNGTSASLGTGVPMPAGFSLRDLANCHDSAEVVSQGLEEPNQEGVNVFPNPSVGGQLTLTGIDGLSQLVVTNAMGSIVWSEDISGDRCSLWLRDSGLYLLRLEGKARTVSTRVIVVE